MKFIKLKKAAWIILVANIIGFIGLGIWYKYASATDIAFVNFSIVEVSEIYKANDSQHIKLHPLDMTETDVKELKDYDMVMINGMGLKMTEEQLEQVKEMGKRGLPIAVVSTRNPSLQFSSLDSLQLNTIKAYLSNATRSNYRSFLAYIRKHIDGKRFFAPEPAKPQEGTDYLFTHADVQDKTAEQKGFNSVKDYEQYLKKNGLWHEQGRRIIITGPMGDPTDLTEQLERQGINVYQTTSLIGTIHQGMIDSIKPNMIINFAHGRLGDFVVNYLKQANIPLFSPLNVNRMIEKWEQDPMGMNGGFLSQSVVTPEIDGALLPIPIFGIYKDKDGMPVLRTIPSKLRQFIQSIEHYAALQTLPNSQKKIAIFYYKGPGQQTLTAQGMEVLPSLYNLLKHLKKEGYNVNGLPATQEAFASLIQKQGALFNPYAEGAMEHFMKTGKPLEITSNDFGNWIHQALRPEMQKGLEQANGAFPGNYMANDGKLALACIRLGNIALMPQYPPATSGDNFQIVHGAHTPPPYPYVAQYLWAQYGWQANAMIHLGTHGSLEFTPQKQVALSELDWPDRLVGSVPHFYIYTIGNVGESIIAKRRSYASLVSYLTPPFMETQLRKTYMELQNALNTYDKLNYDEKAPETAKRKAAMAVKQATVKLGIHRDLRLDADLSRPYKEEEISRIESFAEELANEKITGQLYTLGVPYTEERIRSSVFAIATDPIAYSLYALDKVRKKAVPNMEKRAYLFTQRYLNPAKEVVGKLLLGQAPTDAYICTLAGVTPNELQEARAISTSQINPDDLMAMMMNAAAMSEDKARKMRKGNKMQQKSDKKDASTHPMQGKHPHAAQAGEKKHGMKHGMGHGTPEQAVSKEKMQVVRSIMELERTINNVFMYKKYLLESPQRELQALTNALNGGYTEPSPGGDAIGHPNALPTGRNMYSINAESTPTEAAWEKGKHMAQQTLDLYRRTHHDSLPRKVSYTLWSGEFIESEGATIAQVLYMLGVEPVRDGLGRVTDIRLIPIAELGRPRIDVVVQTSGQLRDLAASRLFLINRAVEMAAQANDKSGENFVKEGVTETERYLVEKGMSPKDARTVSAYRVFGGMNGNYGTGITGMVEAGDKWEDRSEIAKTYLNNMGAFYGSEKGWQSFQKDVFEAALTRTDVVIQPRQNNTWGALSLDHVYEFMGGMSLAVTQVTGKEPEAYFADYRNRNNTRMQELKEAIGVESKTTLLNPTYIKEKMKGGASSADEFTEIIRNTYGWGAMRQSAIDQELWNEIYRTYIEDQQELGIRQYFEKNNPAALQEFTGVMLESARKGFWKANAQQVKQLAKLHAELVSKQAACSEFVCGNSKLRAYVSKQLDNTTQQQYQNKINEALQSEKVRGKDGVVMKKESSDTQVEQSATQLNRFLIIGVVLVLGAGIFVYLRKRRKA